MTGLGLGCMSLVLLVYLRQGSVSTSLCNVFDKGAHVQLQLNVCG